MIAGEMSRAVTGRVQRHRRNHDGAVLQKITFSPRSLLVIRGRLAGSCGRNKIISRRIAGWVNSPWRRSGCPSKFDGVDLPPHYFMSHYSVVAVYSFHFAIEAEVEGLQQSGFGRKQRSIAACEYQTRGQV